MKEEKHTIKPASNENYRNRWGRISGVVGLFANLVLFLSKITIGIAFNSVAITADAINNLSDTATSIITLAGFKMSDKPADEKHPYGHARMEYISGLMVSLVIVFIGFQLLSSSVDKIINPEITEYNLLMVLVLLISISVKWGLWIFYKKIGAKIRSVTLVAASHDSRNDIFATSAILVSIAFYYFTKIDLDAYMGIFVALLIMFFGIKLVIDTTSPLLGLAPSKAFVDKIYKKILGYEGIIGVHDLVVHNYGHRQSYASAHCEVPAERDIMQSHDIIDRIERDFLTEFKVNLVIHLDPVVRDDIRTNTAREMIMRIVKDLSDEIDLHDFRAVWGITHSKFIFDVVIPFCFNLSDEMVVENISEKIKIINPNYSAVITVDHSYVPKM